MQGSSSRSDVVGLLDRLVAKEVSSGLEAWDSFLRAHATLMRRLEVDLAQATGLALAAFDVLAQLARAGGELRMTDLAARALISRSGMTRRVARLVEEGLVLRANADADARGVIVALTDAGVTRLTETAPVYLRGVSELFVARLPDEELAVLANALGKVTVDSTFGSDLDWGTLGAVPEMLQTASGPLTVGLDAQPGQTLLIRGGTSSVGMAAAILARDLGLTILSTTRQPDRVASLEAIGVDHVLVDDGDVAVQARAIVPDGVEAALELVGTNTLPDTLRATAVHGVVCFTGMLSNQWTVPDFYPIDYIPSRVRLTAYGGDAADLPTDQLQRHLDPVAAGRL